MNDRDASTVELGRCLVTGAAGFLGRSLVVELLRRGHEVRAFDCVRLEHEDDRLETAVGDIRRYEDVREACEGIDTIFHTAAVLNFLRFATRAERDESFGVNVEGVRNALRAARDARVRRFVHTSSNNVTFTGPALGEDESWPYATRAKDLYTRTKVLGEKAALAANGREGLLTCAIRPGGIFGEGEGRFLPALVEACSRGRFAIVIGNGVAKSDNVHVDNLVEAQIEAARHLVPGSPVCGQAYFVTDGHPVNYFEFFRPFIAGMGFEFPRWKVPAGPLHAVLWVWELLHRTLRVPCPPLTCMEVRKVSIDHYFRIDRAKRDFGWEPRVSFEECTERCLAYCKELLAARSAGR